MKSYCSVETDHPEEKTIWKNAA